MSKHPLLEWGEHMLANGDEIEVGETWSAETGWRVYMRTGTKMITMAPRQMRRLAESYLKNLDRCPADACDAVRQHAIDMIEVANDAKEKNRVHAIPENAVANIPHRGSA